MIQRIIETDPKSEPMYTNPQAEDYTDDRIMKGTGFIPPPRTSSLPHHGSDPLSAFPSTVRDVETTHEEAVQHGSATQKKRLMGYGLDRREKE